MSETVNQEQTTQQEQTFTQDDLNKIVGERLAREREKYADYDVLKAKAEKYDEATEAAKSELQKAQERASSLESELNGLKKANEVREIRETVAKESGVPVSLLTGTTADECKAQAEGILKFAKPAGYPVIKDGGEVKTPAGGGTTREQFAEFVSNIF